MVTNRCLGRFKVKWLLASPVMALAIGLLIMSMIAMAAPRAVSAADFRIEDFIVLVDDQLLFTGPGSVLSNKGGDWPLSPPIHRRSDLGSRNILQIGGSGSTYVPVEASALTDVAVIGRNVRLRNFAKVSHVIYDDVAGSYSKSGTSIVGPSLVETFAINSIAGTDSDLPAFPAFPTFTASANPLDDVVVAASATVNLAPGIYRDLRVGLKGIVNFTESGIYTFRRIIINQNSNYSLNMLANDIEIRVQDFVALGEYGRINPSAATGVVFYVAGLDDSYAGANGNALGVNRVAGRLPAGQFPAAFQYRGDGIFNACFVFVPNGTINLKGAQTFDTQWFGDSFKQFQAKGFTLQQIIEPPCFEVPGIECACISNFKLLSDGRLRLNGVNFSEDTVFTLEIFSQGYNTALSSFTAGAGDEATVPISELIITASDTMTTKQPLSNYGVSAGNFFMGIVYPVDPQTGNTGGYCIFTDKALVILP